MHVRSCYLYTLSDRRIYGRSISAVAFVAPAVLRDTSRPCLPMVVAQGFSLARPHRLAVFFLRGEIRPALAALQPFGIESQVLSGGEDRIADRAFNVTD